MKIFWSWQSDTPGKIGRHFVRDALLRAIEKLKASPEIDAPIRDALHVDEDRKDVPGSPDLARLILEKIDASSVVVADVTLVSTVDENPAKRLINSNVAIELGYAIKSRGDSNFLMVQNTAYGPITELPFDLRHKAGPVTFELKPSASAIEISTEGQRLSNLLASALKPYALQRPPISELLAAFPERPNAGTRSAYFAPKHSLARADGKDLHYPHNTGFYIRVIPHTPRVRPLSFASLKALGPRVPIFDGGGSYIDLNEDGLIAFNANYETAELRAHTQVFDTGEIWSFSRRYFGGSAGTKALPVTSFERGFRAGSAEPSVCRRTICRTSFH